MVVVEPKYFCLSPYVTGAAVLIIGFQVAALVTAEKAVGKPQKEDGTHNVHDVTHEPEAPASNQANIWVLVAGESVRLLVGSNRCLINKV